MLNQDNLSLIKGRHKSINEVSTSIDNPFSNLNIHWVYTCTHLSCSYHAYTMLSSITIPWFFEFNAMNLSFLPKSLYVHPHVYMLACLYVFDYVIIGLFHFPYLSHMTRRLHLGLDTNTHFLSKDIWRPTVAELT